MEMIKDIKNRNLGLKQHKCRICGEEGSFKSFLVREMFMGTRDEFEYFLCPKCLCLQIADIPDNLGDYYGDSYYSMKVLDGQEFTSDITEHEKILDVGCGSGGWLYEMAEGGHDNLYGCDPFINADIDYGDRVHISKCDITEMKGDGSFDFIRMADSFEHVTNPKEVLQNAERLLKDDGALIMMLPMFPNVAFDMFGTHWYQLDAPRHIFLHSVISLKQLAAECGLQIFHIEYNSNTSMIACSFFYQHGIPYREITKEWAMNFFSDEDVARMLAIAEEANSKGNGDHAEIYMRKVKVDE